MANYVVTVCATYPVAMVGCMAPKALTDRRTVRAACARDAACELASAYVNAGMTVDWSVRRSGFRGVSRPRRGRFVPDTPGDGPAGVGEPRRPGPRSPATRLDVRRAQVPSGIEPEGQPLDLVSRAMSRVSRASPPGVPDIEQAAAMAVHMRGYGEQHFRQI